MIMDDDITREEEYQQEQETVQETPSVSPSGDDSLLDQVMAETRLREGDEGYEKAKQGIREFLKTLIEKEETTERVDKKQVDAMISALDEKLGTQMDEILHNRDFQAMEATWKGLDMLVRRTDFRENIRIHVMNVSKEDLLQDFEDTPDITKSGLYYHVYTSEYGQFGGQPVATIIADYELGPGAQDIKLLRDVSSVSTMAHTPFIAGAGQAFFNIEKYEELPRLKDLESIFEAPQYAKWRGLRESDDARNIGLVMPRFLLRTVYGEENPIKAFAYNEKTDGESENYLWGNAAFAFATRITESFANYRWCPNIIGPKSGGAVLDLPVHTFEVDGETQVVGPVEVNLSDRREFELAELGFIGLTLRKNSDNAAFFSANSVQKPKFFGDTDEGRQAELNYRLGTQLPYMFIITRLAHYIKVLQRENLGSWKTAPDLEAELGLWIRQYISAQDNPPASVRNSRPLKSAEISVSNVPGESGWYNVKIEVSPHMKFMGANFTLSLTGMLEAA